MDNNIQKLIDKINIDKEHYQYFSDAKITRIVVNKQGTIWNIFIDKKELVYANREDCSKFIEQIQYKYAKSTKKKQEENPV